MAIVVRLLDPKWTTTNRIAHVTIGTRDDTVKPKESNELLSRWLEAGAGEKNGIKERAFQPKPTVQGAVRGVLAR
jgi:tRNA ligase